MLLALFSRDAELLAALNSQDVHRWVAAQLFGVAFEDVTERQRRIAKILSFALVYSAFDFDTTVTNVWLQAPELPVDEIKAALNRYMEVFHVLFEWTARALFAWYDSGGWVQYLYGAKKRIIYPDYLKREEKALRKSEAGRVAINTYGQNSVGLLLKFIKQGMRRSPVLRQHTYQPIPVFDAISFLARTENVGEVLSEIDWVMTPVLRHNGFEVRMRVDWKGSLASWGELREIKAPAATRAPWVLEWDTEELAPLEAPPIDNPLNPFFGPGGLGE